MPRFILGVCLAIYLSVTLYQLHLPGLHYDEAFEVVPTLQLLTHQPITPFRESAITLFGRSFPLTTQDYIGALNTYGALPFLAWGGINVFSLRLYSALVGLITLLLVYGFGTDFAQDQRAGLVAVALLALNPTFVFWSRQGIFVTAITTAIGVAAAWSWLRWWRSRRYRYALAGSFLFGLGIYAKLLFIWLIAALFGAFMISQWPAIRRAIRKVQVNKRLALQTVGLAGALIAGMGPLILYNLQTGGTFKSIGDNAGVSYYGVNNSDVIGNLVVRIEQWTTLLSSSHLWYLGEIYTNCLVVGGFIGALIIALWPAKRQKRTDLLIPFVVIGLVIVESIITVSALWVTHYALIMVWPALAIATVGVWLWQHVETHPAQPMVHGVLIGLLVILLSSEALTTRNYHRALAQSGGLSGHSDAVYDLAAWLEAHAESRPAIAMDWGMAAPITFLTEGQVTVVEGFGYAWDTSPQFESILTPHLSPQSAIFLWRAPDEIIFDRSTDFKKLYHPLELEENILQAFYEQNGRPILGATELVPIGTAANKPQAP